MKYLVKFGLGAHPAGEIIDGRAADDLNEAFPDHLSRLAEPAPPTSLNTAVAPPVETPMAAVKVESPVAAAIINTSEEN